MKLSRESIVELIEKQSVFKIILNPNFIFLSALLFFVADSVVNYFIDVPVFVPFAIAFLPFIFLAIYISKGSNKAFVISGIFIITAIVNNLIYGFRHTNASDLIFILLFITAYYYYTSHHKDLKTRTIYIFTLVVLAMISFSIADLNSRSFWKNNTIPKQIEQEFKNQTPIIEREPNELNHLETGRKYHYGLFRIPHIAAYFLGFLSLFFAYLYHKQQNWLMLAAALLLFALMLYSGVRTFIAAVMLSLILYLFQRKTLFYLLLLIGTGIVAIIFRYEVFELTSDTFLEPFSAILITFTDNFISFSRVLIWQSWWMELSDFSWIDLLTGKSFYKSQLANFINLKANIWFHNDFLSIAYVYGIPALLAYIWFFVRIFMDNAAEIRKNIFIFLFYFSMIFTALLNGFYYYFPIFLIFIFVWMLKQEAAAARQVDVE